MITHNGKSCALLEVMKMNLDQVMLVCFSFGRHEWPELIPEKYKPWFWDDNSISPGAKRDLQYGYTMPFLQYASYALDDDEDGTKILQYYNEHFVKPLNGQS